MHIDGFENAKLGDGNLDNEEGDDPVDPELHGDPVADQQESCQECEVELQEPTDQEAQSPKTLTSPITPTQKEIDEHYINHLPYRSWCPCCVMGRANEDPHRKVNEESKQSQIPTIGIDFGFAGEEEEIDDKINILVVKDHKTRAIFAHACESKSPDDEMVTQVCEDIEQLGYSRIAVKTDGEPATIKLQKMIMKRRVQDTVPVNPPAHSSQSQGPVERGVQSVKGQIRVSKVALEQRLGKPVKSHWPVMTWMTEHVGNMLTCYEVGKDGKTAYQRLYGKKAHAALAEFGEQILYKPAEGKKKRKMHLQQRWYYGTWLGITRRSNEAIVATSTGAVVKVRSVRRRPADVRWSAEKIEGIKGTPQKPDPKIEDRQLHPAIQVEVTASGVDVKMPETTDEVQHAIKRLKITKQILDNPKVGYTKGCPGCNGLRYGTAKANHSDACRKRVEDALAQTTEGSEVLQKSQDRIKAAKKRRLMEESQEETKNTKEGVQEGSKDNESCGAKGSKRQVEDDSQGEQDSKVKQARTDKGIDLDDPKNYQEYIDEDDKIMGESSSSSGPAGEKRPTPEDAEMTDGDRKRIRIQESIDAVWKQMDNSGTAKRCSKEDVARVLEELDNMQQEQEVLNHRQRRSQIRRLSREKGAQPGSVSEVYSPPRIAKMAKEMGLKSGWSLDLTTEDADGKAWDFNDPDMKRRAVKKICTDKPGLLIVSPMCAAFSQLQTLNYTKLTEAEVRRKLWHGIEHLSFALSLCELQAKEGRSFIFEHPVAATSWKLKCTQKVLALPGVVKVHIDMCQYGMKSHGESGEEGLVKKRTGIMTNSMSIAKRLMDTGKCTGDHEHVHLTGGRAKSCEVYPEEFCRCICRGYKDELEKHGMQMRARHQSGLAAVVQGLLELRAVQMPSPHDEDPMEQYDDMEFTDDVSGKPLDSRLAVKARKLEIDFFRKMKVYTKVLRSEIGEGKVLTTRWIDVNKGDLENPDYRSRLVGREIRKDNRLDLFAATPPLESLRYIISKCARNQRRGFKILTVDVKRAYFYASARRDIYVEIPEEDREPGDEYKVGKLNLSLYGTRDAAQNWAIEYTETLKSLGFKCGLASPCNFHNAARDISVTVHGDDFTATGDERSLTWFKSALSRKYDIKHSMLGPGDQDLKEVRVLNRVIRWTDESIEYEADQRHAEIVTKEMGLDGSNSVKTPGVKATEELPEDQWEPLDASSASRFRALAARINYLAADRPDLQYSAKEVSRWMSKPCRHHWEPMKRLARYLLDAGRMIQEFKWQDDATTKITTFTDSDWAGCKQTRKSTSGGAITIGQHMLKSWATSQTVVALSSGEAELYAMTKAASQTIGIMSMAADFGETMSGEVRSDASAAIGIVHRQGLGKVRHIEVQNLWLQEHVASGKLKVSKVAGEANPADLMTKFLSRPDIDYKAKMLGFQVVQGRADTAPQLQ